MLKFPSFVLQGQRGGGFRLSRRPFHREGPSPNPSRYQIQGGSASHILTLPAQPAHPGSQNRWLCAALNSAEDTGHAVRIRRHSEAVDAVYQDTCFCGVCICRASREVPQGHSWLELAARQPWQHVRQLPRLLHIHVQCFHAWSMPRCISLPCHRLYFEVLLCHTVHCCLTLGRMLCTLGSASKRTQHIITCSGPA